MDDATYEKMKKAQEAYHPRAMSIPGVHGTSIGLKRVAGKLTNTFAIHIHLTKKRPLDDVAADERIPEEIEGFPTDVIEHEQPSPGVGDIRRLSQSVDDGKYRPLEGGIQLRTPEKYGTIGCMVYETLADKSKVYYALSCQHVLGDVGNSVFQPDYTHKDRIGNVERAVLSIDVDGGISTISWYDDAGAAKIVEIGGVNGTYTVVPKDLPYVVRKRGRTTRLRSGEIVALNYQGDRTDGWDFTGQDYIEADGGFAEPGDSGSAVVDSKNNVVGLLWGADKHFAAYSSPIAPVLQQLNVKMFTKYESIALPPYSDTLTGKLEDLFNQSARENDYWLAYCQDKTYVEHLFHQVPRLQATWLKTPQIEFMDMLRAGIRDPDSKIPSTIGTEDTGEVLAKLCDALAGYLVSEQKDELNRQIDSLRHVIADNIGRSWREALSGQALLQKQ